MRQQYSRESPLKWFRQLKPWSSNNESSLIRSTITERPWRPMMYPMIRTGVTVCRISRAIHEELLHDRIGSWIRSTVHQHLCSRSSRWIRKEEGFPVLGDSYWCPNDRQSYPIAAHKVPWTSPTCLNNLPSCKYVPYICSDNQCEKSDWDQSIQ